MKNAVICENVDKNFILEHQKKTTLFEHLFKRGDKKEVFCALKDISFKVKKGEMLGLIGPNGAGKSTLLKVIAGIMKPSNGRVITKGSIINLELGVGFHQELTARENVLMYGSILGLSENYLKNKFDDIIRFAGLRKFKDTQLKNFSSGMRVRLAFSTAIQTNPKILLIDEAFAVGDKDFRKKCLDVLNKFKKEGKTIIMATHSLEMIKSFCDRAILINNGKIINIGKPGEVINKYNELRPRRR
jgi:lipopolysaccharide transport system ATP-binding protein